MAEKKTKELEALLIFLRDNRGFDFTGYKRSTLERRIQKHLKMRNIDSYEAYQEYLEVHPEEFNFLFNSILINVTSFFRDKPAWDFVAEQIIPKILASKRENEQIRIWSAGCASGEEPYSLAMLLAEALGKQDFQRRVKIYATDIDEEALMEARRACYSAESIKDIDPVLSEKYFQKDKDLYQFDAELRRKVIFGSLDLVKDSPISRIDLLSCRNTLMYFNTETQIQILNRFRFALRDTGFLFLGKAEMMVSRTNSFLPENMKFRILKKTASVNRANTGDASLSTPGNETQDAGFISNIDVWENILNALNIAGMVVNKNNLLVMISHPFQDMFQIDRRDNGRPLQDLEISYRPIDLRSLIDQVYTSREAVSARNVRRSTPGNGQQFLDFRVIPLPYKGKELEGVLIICSDETRTYMLQEELRVTNQELETSNEELQSGNEELETTNEELQSTNEELETTNEELQATNEEMETINEELQSTNEELETINTELNQRTDELNKTNAYINSILSNLDSAVIVIDTQHNVTSWNSAARDQWGLDEKEVMRKSLFDLDIGLPVKALKEPISASLKTNKRSDLELEGMNRRGKKSMYSVHCSPLISNHDQILGAILLIDPTSNSS